MVRGSQWQEAIQWVRPKVNTITIMKCPWDIVNHYVPWRYHEVPYSWSLWWIKQGKKYRWITIIQVFLLHDLTPLVFQFCIHFPYLFPPKALFLRAREWMHAPPIALVDFISFKEIKDIFFNFQRKSLEWSFIFFHNWGKFLKDIKILIKNDMQDYFNKKYVTNKR